MVNINISKQNTTFSFVSEMSWMCRIILRYLFCTFSSSRCLAASSLCIIKWKSTINTAKEKNIVRISKKILSLLNICTFSKCWCRCYF
jgi:hypothetical protein